MRGQDDLSVPALVPPSPWNPPLCVLAGDAFARIGKGLVLRFWEDGDAAALFDAIEAGRASFLPWLPWVRTHNRSVDECVATVQHMRSKRTRMEPIADDFTLGVFDEATGRALGGTGLHRVVHEAHEAEIGYWVRPENRGEGICGRAVSVLLSWAFTPQVEGGWGLRRVHIRCAGRNLASQRVPRKLGLREEGRLIGERWVDTIGWDDTLVWGVRAHEWDARRDEIRPEFARQAMNRSDA